jgi:hypothetical protein
MYLQPYLTHKGKGLQIIEQSPDTPDFAMLKSLHLQAAIISAMLTATLWAVQTVAPSTQEFAQFTPFSLQR